MGIWTKLSSEIAHEKFRVPEELAQSGANLFLGQPPFPGDDPYKMDGDWPFAAIIMGDKSRNKLRLIVNSIPIEFIIEKDYSPLNDGQLFYLMLSQSEMATLFEFMIRYCIQLNQSAYDTDAAEFSLITELSELQELRLIQRPNPKVEYLIFKKEDNHSAISVIKIARYSGIRESFGMDLIGFNKADLQNPKFKPYFSYKSVILTSVELTKIIKTIDSRFHILSNDTLTH